MGRRKAEGAWPSALRLKGPWNCRIGLIGRRFLLDVVEFIRAFAPLFDGFRSRAEEVRNLLKADGTRFLLVAGPGPDRVPDAMFFLRKLKETGHRLGPILVNQVHPDPVRLRQGRTRDGPAALPGGPGPARPGAAPEPLPGRKMVIPVALEPVPPADLLTLGRLYEKLSTHRPY